MPPGALYGRVINMWVVVFDHAPLGWNFCKSQKCLRKLTQMITIFEKMLYNRKHNEIVKTTAIKNDIKEFQRCGIPTVVWLCPTLPYINDTVENLNKILDYCFDAGVKGIINFGFGVTLRAGNREYFYRKLDEHFPGMKERYICRFGDSYECASENSAALWKVFADRCRKAGVMTSPDEIFAYLREYPVRNEQLSLFD